MNTAADQWYSRSFHCGRQHVNKGEKRDVFLMFVDKAVVKLCKEMGVTALFVDGTFSIAPPFFSQVLQVVAEIRGEFVVLCTGLVSQFFDGNYLCISLSSVFYITAYIEGRNSVHGGFERGQGYLGRHHDSRGRDGLRDWPDQRAHSRVPWGWNKGEGLLLPLCPSNLQVSEHCLEKNDNLALSSTGTDISTNTSTSTSTYFN